MNAKELAEKCGTGHCGCLKLRNIKDKKLCIMIFNFPPNEEAWFSESPCTCCAGYGGCYAEQLDEIPLTDDLLVPILLTFGGTQLDEIFVKWQGKQIAKFVLGYLKNR